MKIKLNLTVERTARGSYFVSDDVFSRMGDGPTLAEALDDYGEMLVAYFEALDKDPKRLHLHLRKHWAILSTVFASFKDIAWNQRRGAVG